MPQHKKAKRKARKLSKANKKRNKNCKGGFCGPTGKKPKQKQTMKAYSKAVGR